jgi:hypothetical protein
MGSRNTSLYRRDRQIVKLARAFSGVVGRLDGKDPCDDCALEVILEIMRTFAQEGKINLHSIEREVRSKFANVEQQVRSWRLLMDMYLGVQHERLLVMNLKRFLNDELVAQTLLMGVFGGRRLDVILSKSKEYILGECNAKPGFSTTMEDLEKIEEMLRTKFGFHFDMTEDQIRRGCEAKIALCHDKINALLRDSDD